MNGTKPFWQSRTVIATLIGGVAAILDIFGVTLPNQEILTENVYKAVEAAALAYALYGRIRAKTVLT